MGLYACVYVCEHAHRTRQAGFTKLEWELPRQGPESQQVLGSRYYVLEVGKARVVGGGAGWVDERVCEFAPLSTQ